MTLNQDTRDTWQRNISMVARIIIVLLSIIVMPISLDLVFHKARRRVAWVVTSSRYPDVPHVVIQRVTDTDVMALPVNDDSFDLYEPNDCILLIEITGRFTGIVYNRYLHKSVQAECGNSTVESLMLRKFDAKEWTHESK